MPVCYNIGIFFMDTNWETSFKEKLNEHYTWPSLYLFKFIILAGQEEHVYSLMPEAQFKLNPSANGKYVSVTFEIKMQHAEAVVEIYKKASLIKGLIAL